ncbi:class I SAM-dependent methyltransferase [Micromonospora purpureochromogenes]|nr:class I SAM-dependent methyltransferase [Micromonospora purpureochromogenes]
MELLPPPPCQVLDVGAGEGRLTRAMTARGYSVFPVERSLGMLRALQVEDGNRAALNGDACALPIRPGSVDCVVSLMVLMSIADAMSAVREAARVLRDGGLAVFAVLHPLVTCGRMGDDGDLRVSDYGNCSLPAPRRVQRRVPLTYEHFHRPIGTYLSWSIDAGLTLEAVVEPLPGAEQVAAHPRFRRWAGVPNMLLWTARRRVSSP